MNTSDVLLSIDPGSAYSAYCIVGSDYSPFMFDKLPNAAMEKFIRDAYSLGVRKLVIEMVASYGMAVGAEVFETCVWIGRFMQIAESIGMQTERLFRKDVKLNLCHSPRARDSNVRQALIDRFAKHDLKNGKGTKRDPDWFYGFRADVWAAYAVGVTYIDEANTKLRYGRKS